MIPIPEMIFLIMMPFSTQSAQSEHKAFFILCDSLVPFVLERFSVDLVFYPNCPAIKIAAGGRCAPSVRLRGHHVHAGELLRRKLSCRKFIGWCRNKYFVK